MSTSSEGSSSEGEQDGIGREGPVPRTRTGASPPPPSNSSFSETFGAFGPNLRGSASASSHRGRRTRTEDRGVDHHIYHEKITIKITLKELPDTYAAYNLYRFKMKQKIRNTDLPGTVITPFLRDLERFDIVALKRDLLEADEMIINLESKLFSAILDACHEVKHSRHIRAIQTGCDEGGGSAGH
jgi:hypothetical protein